MKKFLVILSCILTVFLAACGQEDVPATDYDYVAYEPNDVVEDDVADNDAIEENVIDYECIQLTEFPTDWSEMFETSFCEWFGEDTETQVLEWLPGGGSRYQHPLDDEVTMVFFYGFQWADFPLSMRLSTAVFMNQESTSITELQELLGDELLVFFSDYNGRWQAMFDVNEYFTASLILESENDDNITQITIRRGQRERPLVPILTDFSGHELVGRWRIVASYDIFGVRHETDDEWVVENDWVHLMVFANNGMGYTYTSSNHLDMPSSHMTEFNWVIIDGEVHEKEIWGGHIWIWSYEINGDVLRIIRIIDPDHFIHVDGVDDIDTFKEIREFIRVG